MVLKQVKAVLRVLRPYPTRLRIIHEDFFLLPLSTWLFLLPLTQYKKIIFNDIFIFPHFSFSSS
jgi:hypothetical protein